MCSCVTSDVVQPNSAMDQKVRRGNTQLAQQIPPIISICFSTSLSFSAIRKETGRQWEIVWEDVGCVGATASFIAPWCNNQGGKAAGLHRCCKIA
jgi:hypothetical protein